MTSHHWSMFDAELFHANKTILQEESNCEAIKVFKNNGIYGLQKFFVLSHQQIYKLRYYDKVTGTYQQPSQWYINSFLILKSWNEWLLSQENTATIDWMYTNMKNIDSWNKYFTSFGLTLQPRTNGEPRYTDIYSNENSRKLVFKQVFEIAMEEEPDGILLNMIQYH